MKTPALETPPAHSPFAKWLPLILFLLTLLCFKNVLPCQLINLDDPTYVTDSPIRQGFTLPLIKWAFTNDFHAGFYIPITWLSYALDVTLMGYKAEAFHLTNLVFHAFNSVLIYILLTRFSPDKWRAFAVAAIWAVHPLRVESVAWITERKDVLFVFFALCSLLAYFQYVQTTSRHRKWFYLLSLAMFALSLLSKPTLIMFPFLLLMIDWWPLRRFQARSFNVKILLEKIPFLLFAVTIGVITLLAQKQMSAVVSFEVVGIAMRIETAICGYGAYLLQTIYPVNLAALIAFPMSWPIDQVVLSALAIIVLTALCLWIWRRNKACRAPLFGWLWFVFTLLPTSGLLQSGPQAYADRFTYFPSIGLVLAIVFAIPSAWRLHPRVAKILVAVFVAAITIEGVLTTNQINTWHDGGTLWRQTLSVSPNNITAHLNYAAYLIAEGNDPQGAIEQCKWVVDRYPIDAVAWNNWGVVLERRGDLTGALEKYSHAADAAPSQAIYQVAVTRVQLEIRNGATPTTRP